MCGTAAGAGALGYPYQEPYNGLGGGRRVGLLRLGLVLLWVRLGCVSVLVSRYLLILNLPI